MKKTLEFLYKYLPYIPLYCIGLMLFYIIIAGIYFKEIPVQDFSSPASYFDSVFGLHDFRWFIFYTYIVSIFLVPLWVIISFLGWCIYLDNFEGNKLNIFIVFICIIADCLITSITNGWFWG